MARKKNKKAVFPEYKIDVAALEEARQYLVNLIKFLKHDAKVAVDKDEENRVKHWNTCFGRRMDIQHLGPQPLPGPAQHLCEWYDREANNSFKNHKPNAKVSTLLHTLHNMLNMANQELEKHQQVGEQPQPQQGTPR